MRTSFSVNDMTIHRIVEQEAGFTPKRMWTDPERLFSVHWLEA